MENKNHKNHKRQEPFNKCQICGKFFSFADIESGRAIYRMITPDSYVSAEEWEALCPYCKIKKY